MSIARARRPLPTVLILLFLASCKAAGPRPPAGASAPPAPASPEGGLPGAAPFGRELALRLARAAREQRPGERPRTRHLLPDGAPRYTNRLLLSDSPYLRQHAHNPVDFYPWGEEAFQAARRLRRPLLLSIGYSTCHWCHVMEEESFDDEEIARYLNRNYVAIKVDREQRPDLDAVYMSAVQALTGGGGWPMTVWLTPERRPYYGGTYFPARDGDRGARVGFLTLLVRMKEAYDREPERVAQSADQLVQAIRAELADVSMPAGAGPPDAAVLDAAAGYYRARFDRDHGGLLGAPKFPSSLPVRFLLRQHLRSGDEALRQQAVLTLRRMARGGIHDQVGGGFHRYATDAEWLVPHFEKMLYDNALLVLAYLEGAQAAASAAERADFARVAREVLDYVEREMTDRDGGFYSATDADSAGPGGRREEGRFFTWTPEEFAAVLGPQRGRALGAYLGVSAGGQLEGRSVLHVTAGTEPPGLAEARRLLYAARQRRPPPLLDDKVLGAWNGLMISAFARAALLLGEPRYAGVAARAAEFLLARLRRQGRLLRSYRPGQPHAEHAGCLPDYAFVIAGLLDLHEATGTARYLGEALALEQVLERRFEDPQGGGFFLTADDGEPLLVREKPAYDGAEPAGNSVQALNLFRLHELTLDDRYRQRGERTLGAFAERLRRAPAALSEMLLAIDFHYGRPRAIVLVAAPGADAEPFLRALRAVYLPRRVLALVSGDESARAEQERLLPIAREKAAQGGRTTAYVCDRGACALPTTDPAAFQRQLQALGARAASGRGRGPL